jgi:hypothetical protein
MPGNKSAVSKRGKMIMMLVGLNLAKMRQNDKK